MYNHQLDTFLKVAELGSFSKAAESLFISAPAVIQQMNLLEADCGFSLFIRTNHGVSLTPAGKSLCDDAKTLIRFSEDSLRKARSLAESSETTVRIGTSLLYKCRLLPELWVKVSEHHPELKIEIIPMGVYQQQGTAFAELGNRYDLFEGIYASSSWRSICQFLELERTPLCCAVSKNHRLAHMKKLTMQDLNGEYLIMPMAGVSGELDAFRKHIMQKYPTIRIIDSSRYDLDTFTLCEMNSYVLLTQPVYQDIHPDLVTIPLKTKITLPYGLAYANEPTPAAQKFIDAVKSMVSLA